MDFANNLPSGMPSIKATGKTDPPAWALLERQLIAVMNEAAGEFVRRYTRPDGTLVWRDDWPGMDGSDDAYESFGNFPLFYVLGGADNILQTADRAWDAVTWQWTQYGTVDREFDRYYDWMHHGEGYLSFYYNGLACPYRLKDVQRARRFAAMYTGDDPLAPNFDRERLLIRSPITGSDGPRFVQTREDWVTHRPVLDHYLPPFEDIPGVPDGPVCPWSDDAVYDQIIDLINKRMARGDVPLNLNCTSLLTHAFMQTGDDRFRRWVVDYIDAWNRRIHDNGGIIPDNVGLSGRIGEYMDGKWWGGYYGWRWPHGAVTVIEPLVNAGCNAVLLTGDTRYLDIARSQIDKLWSLGREEDGVWLVPYRHYDAGWCDYRPMNIQWPLNCYLCSFADEDWQRVERVMQAGPPKKQINGHIAKGNRSDNNQQWVHFIRGDNPGYPDAILRSDYDAVAARMAAIRNDQGPAADWDIHHWQDKNPVMCNALAQLTMASPLHIYHGGLMNATLRCFDADARRPGLPPDVAMLAGRQNRDRVDLEIVNLNTCQPRSLILEAGSFGQHAFSSLCDLTDKTEFAVDSQWLRVNLPPSAHILLQAGLRRYVHTPSYDTPWRNTTVIPAEIKGREPS